MNKSFKYLNLEIREVLLSAAGTQRRTLHTQDDIVLYYLVLFFFKLFDNLDKLQQQQIRNKKDKKKMMMCVQTMTTDFPKVIEYSVAAVVDPKRIVKYRTGQQIFKFLCSTRSHHIR